MSKQKIVRVGILGAAGRMGQALVRCIFSFPGLTLAGALEADGNSAVGKDAGLIAGTGASGVIISEDIRQIAERVDVCIDFSSPAASAEHAVAAGEMKIGLVIGTTGLNNKQAEAVKAAAAAVPVVWAPNMSKGVNLLFNLVEQAAGILGDYDVEIIETHHRHKKDAPSGTALGLVRAAAVARKLDPETAVAHGRHGHTGERPVAQIGVHAVRAGDVVGDHTVVLACEGERLELTHKASSRDCFAMGALQAAEWVAGRVPGLYSMKNVLDLDR